MKGWKIGPGPLSEPQFPCIMCSTPNKSQSQPTERHFMSTVSLRGNPVNTSGNLPSIGSKAPDFHLVKQDLSTISLSDLVGKKVVLNIFPSVARSEEHT